MARKPGKKPAGKARARKAAPKTAARGRGRPTKYHPAFAGITERLCANGATDAEVADALGVDTSTVWRWRAAHSEFCSALRVGKTAADDRVVRGLYQRAAGYSYTATKIMQHCGKPVVVPYTAHEPPDPTAARLWLVNRRPHEWRDVGKVEMRADVRSESRVDLSGIDDATLAALGAILGLGDIADIAADMEPPADMSGMSEAERRAAVTRRAGDRARRIYERQRQADRQPGRREDGDES